MTLSRRRILKVGAGCMAATSLLGAGHLLAHSKSPRFKIGACDWSIGKRHQVDAMELAKKLGLDGVQVSLGPLENNHQLTSKTIQQQYLDASKTYGVAIGGIAIGELNNVPYKTDPRTDQWVHDSIGTAKNMGCRVVLLAFFAKGDLKGDKSGTKTVIEKLKRVAPVAEEQGIILGIESWLNAEEHLEIIHAVDSQNVRVYYDVANSNKMGYNIYEEIRSLGTEYICEIHAKENGYLLGQGRIDFEEVRQAVDDIGYSGWIQIESAVPEGADIMESYHHNVQFMRKMFS